MIAAGANLLFKLIESLFHLVLMVLTLVVRQLPSFLRLLLEIAQMLLKLSVSAYGTIIALVAPPVRDWLRIELSRGLWRYALTIFLSLTWGVLLNALLPWDITAWIMGLAAIHGVLVCMAWDGDESGGGMGDGLDLGVDKR